MIMGIALIVFGSKIPEFSIFITLGILKCICSVVDFLVRLAKASVDDSKSRMGN